MLAAVPGFLPASAAAPAAPASDSEVRVLHVDRVLRQVGDPDHDVMTQAAVVAAKPARPSSALAVSAGGEGTVIRYAWTADRGRSWHPRTLRGLTTGTGGSWDSVAFPSAAMGTGRDAYLVTQVRKGDCHTAFAVARSANQGRAFRAPVLAVQTFSCAHFNAKPWLAVDTDRRSPHFGRLYLSYLQFHLNEDGDNEGQQQFVRYSDDRGGSWSTPTALTGARRFTHLNSVVVQPQTGDVTVLYGYFTPDFPANRTDMISRTSSDGGATFGPPVLVTRNFIGFTGNADVRCCMPVLSVDPATGVMYVVLGDLRFRQTDDDLNDILLFRSSDGRAWSDPVLVNTGDHNRPLEHFTPSVGAYDDTVYVSWTRRFATATLLSNRLQQQVAVSSDGGDTFGPPTAIGPPGDIRFAPPAPNGFAPRYLSDYNTTVAVPGHAYTAWPLPTEVPSGRAHQTVWAATVTTSHE